jgi:hypothetical protein
MRKVFRVWEEVKPVLTLQSSKLFVPHSKSIDRVITEPSTRIPPTKAQGPGVSPLSKRTHRGFKTGSIPIRRMASRVVTCLMALARSKSGRASWKTPIRRSPIQLLALGIKLDMIGNIKTKTPWVITQGVFHYVRINLL